MHKEMYYHYHHYLKYVQMRLTGITSFSFSIGSTICGRQVTPSEFELEREKGSYENSLLVGKLCENDHRWYKGSGLKSKQINRDVVRTSECWNGLVVMVHDLTPKGHPEMNFHLEGGDSLALSFQV